MHSQFDLRLLPAKSHHFFECIIGQWQLPFADGFRVRTRVPGVWGSIPSQVDPITHACYVDQFISPE